MDTNELRSLHEAYLDVYRGEQLYEEVTAESYDRKGQGKLLKKMQSLAKPDPDSTVKQNQKRRERSDKMYDKNLTSYVRPKGIPGGVGGPEWKSRQNKERGTQKEEVSIYDIVLSHLLDEGYADTVESAEGIMVNMSEEWRDDIVEELTGERRKRAQEKIRELRPKGRRRKSTDAAVSAIDRVVRSKEGGKDSSKFPTKRGGEGEKGKMKSYRLGGSHDRGAGNKAARRAGTYQDPEDY